MLDQKIIDTLKSTYDSLPKVTVEEKGDGWINLVDFAPAIKAAGVDYKRLGFEKLTEVIFESKAFNTTLVPTSGPVPARFIKIKEKRPISYTSPRPSNRVDSEEVAKIKKRLRLDNDLFIGQFAPQATEGWYKISDIRNTDFTKIEDKERGVKDLTISFKSLNKTFNKFAYYKFTWVLLETSPLKFGIDLKEEVTNVWPKDIVESLYEGIMRYPAGAAKKISRSLDTLKKQLTQSGKEVFIYELLQNANDYPRKRIVDQKTVPIPVDVEFHISENYLTFQHTGEYFNPKNIAAICDINDGEKAGNTEAIGYKGIGFKTVFLDNDYVFLNTGNYSFRFDKSATDVINTPWQILPIWTERNEISRAINDIFAKHPNDEFRVKFALQPKDKSILTAEDRDDNYIDLFSNVFDSERVILFIPNIHKVSVFIEGRDEPIVREKDNKDWCVSDALVDDIPEEITEKINDVLNNPDSLRSDGYEKIPEKYINFRKTSVKFACKKEGRKLLPVEDAILYCYLPAKRADWGFNFLMNTDMVPNGQRDDIEDIELNHEIAKIAGRQFFYWIKQLIASREYEFDSIFSLIPDFGKCKKRRVYKDFIEEFQDEFETLIKEEPFVPVVDEEGNPGFKCINEIIDDRTGLTAEGVMSDKDFLKLMEIEDGFLPELELRQSESFMKFLFKYSPADYDIDSENVIEKCETEEFQEWLEDCGHNTQFIKHWLDREELESFEKKSIFIEYEGGLFAVDDLYYDYDTHFGSLDFLRKYVPHLCKDSREKLEEDENWESFADNHFLDFDPADMIESYVIPNTDAMALLEDTDNSVAFYRFMADNDVDLKENCSKIPYITENGESSSTDYVRHRYFFSEEAANLTQEAWLGDNTVNVLSNKYFDNLSDDGKKSLTSLFARLGFIEFDKAGFITSVLLGDDVFKGKVNAAIEDDFIANKAFVRYVFDSEAQIKELSLKDYVLCCIDTDGNEQYLCNDDVRYFDQDAYMQNSTYQDNVGHKWLLHGMMYALSNAYFNDYDEGQAKKLESFFRQQFGIKTFTDKSFFLDVVIKNRSAIYEKLTDKESMLTFLEYLKRDANRIFDDTISFNNVKDMPLLGYDGNVIKERGTNIQYLEYDDAAISLCEKSWCPNLFIVLDKSYTDDFTQDVRQLFKIAKFEVNYALGSILNSDALKQSVRLSINNYDFWRWVKENQSHITNLNQLATINLLDKDGALSEPSSLYISDTYQQDNIESLVTRYVKTAKFVSPSYIEKSTEGEKSEWMKLFKKIGLKSDNKDILFSDILPNLASFEEDSVISMMSNHLKDLKEKWAEISSKVVQLKVRTQSGAYKPINQVIIVNVAEESVVEPFKYITLSNEVHPDILKNNKDLLLLISSEFGNTNLITTKQIWIEAKVKDYISKFDADNNSINGIHIQFVRELAKMQSDYPVPADLMKHIKYRTRGEEFSYMSASELTLGTIYSPTCDFEANGVTELSYLSNDYIFEGNKDNIKSFFKGEGLHQNMMREDLKYLSNRAFACYFWSYSFSRRVTEYEMWIEEGLFNNLVCIPTENSVHTPESLYSPQITAGYAVRARVPEWQEKVAYKAVVDKIENRDARDLFLKLHFCNTLSFEDCLYYLSNVNDRREDESDHRKMIITWILASQNIDAALVDEYREKETSTWRNGKGQKKHIKELYAIHPDATQEKNIFWGDEFVMQTGCFPPSTESFERVCDILKIKYLKSGDFIATPINKVDETSKMIAILRPRILVLAAIDNPEKFEHLYERYNEKLSQYQFYMCEKIDLGYDTIHNDVMRIYNDDSHLYYVASWLHNRTFTKFCSSVRKLIECYVDSDVCEDVFDINNSVEASINKYCSSLAYNAHFQSYLKSLDLTINIVVEEEAQETVADDYYSEAHDIVKEQEESNGTSTSVTEPEVKTIGSDEVNKDSSDTLDHSTESQEQPAIKKEECSDDNIAATTTPATEKIKEPASDVPLTDEKTSVERQEHEDKEVSPEPDTVPETETDTYVQIADDDDYGDTVEEPYEESSEPEESEPQHSGSSNKPKRHEYDPDNGGTMGSVHKDNSYQQLGETPQKPKTRKHPKPYTAEELERLRSKGTPLELESLPPTEEEIDLLAQCGISPEQIADTNYLAQLRLYLNLTREQNEEPEETMSEFVHNADDVTSHMMKDGRYIHTCSAARGVMYISPSVWSKMVDDKWKICVYLDGQGKNFHYINNVEEFLKLVVKDDIVIKITGNEKVDVVNALYSGILKGVKGTAYTLIRVASRTNMDAVFAHYIGAMAESDDGNDDTNDY